jgi:enoyl-CoA hydratase/carnithine racemase
LATLSEQPGNVCLLVALAAIVAGRYLGESSAMTSEHILTDLSGGVFTVTLNRPDKMNSITPDMHRALDAAFDRCAADDAAQVCIVTGAGERAFCAGSDLSLFDPNAPYPRSGYAGLIERFDLAKPVIAAVNGVALGGGFEIALACDLIVSSPKAVFGLPEPKVGLIAVGGGVHRLVRQAGLKRAMVPLLTGRNISAQECFEMGLISEIAEGDVLAAAKELAMQIIANAPLAVRLSKALAMWGLDQPTLQDAIVQQSSHSLFGPWREARDTTEGPKAFAEKRRPDWQGR